RWVARPGTGDRACRKRRYEAAAACAKRKFICGRNGRADIVYGRAHGCRCFAASAMGRRQWLQRRYAANHGIYPAVFYPTGKCLLCATGFSIYLISIEVCQEVVLVSRCIEYSSTLSNGLRDFDLQFHSYHLSVIGLVLPHSTGHGMVHIIYKNRTNYTAKEENYYNKIKET